MNKPRYKEEHCDQCAFHVVLSSERTPYYVDWCTAFSSVLLVEESSVIKRSVECVKEFGTEND